MILRSDIVLIGCGRETPMGRCHTGELCGNCTELLALRRRVAELEATAARRLELLWPFAKMDTTGWRLDFYYQDAIRAAAAEVAAGKGGDRG